MFSILDTTTRVYTKVGKCGIVLPSGREVARRMVSQARHHAFYWRIRVRGSSGFSVSAGGKKRPGLLHCGGKGTDAAKYSCLPAIK